jgi:hypothetical protein
VLLGASFGLAQPGRKKTVPTRRRISTTALRFRLCAIIPTRQKSSYAKTSIIRGLILVLSAAWRTGTHVDPLLNSTGVPVRTSSRDDRRIRSGAFFWRPTKARSRLQGVHVVRFSIVAVGGTTGRCQQVNFRVLHLLPKSRGSVFSQQMNSIRPPV